MSTGNIPIVRCAGRKSRCNVRATATATSTGRASDSGRDYYKVLSLEHGADVGAEDIKRPYWRLALRHHPDVCPASTRRAKSTELFLELRRAYETLSDPARKVRYDADLRAHIGEVARRRGVAFARDVWESQLSVLRARSEQRQRARRSSQP